MINVNGTGLIIDALCRPEIAQPRNLDLSRLIAPDAEATDKLRAAIKEGTCEFVLAVHCRQTRGGQYIDVGIVDVATK